MGSLRGRWLTRVGLGAHRQGQCIEKHCLVPVSEPQPPHLVCRLSISRFFWAGHGTSFSQGNPLQNLDSGLGSSRLFSPSWSSYLRQNYCALQVAHCPLPAWPDQTLPGCSPSLAGSCFRCRLYSRAFPCVMVVSGKMLHHCFKVLQGTEVCPCTALRLHTS